MPSERHLTVDWRGGMRFESTSQSGTGVVFDSSPEHGGENKGWRPMELLLATLAGCTGMDVISLLRKKRQHVTDFQVRVDGIRQDEHPKIYTNITITYVVTGHDVDPVAVARSIELSTAKYCPVFATIDALTEMCTAYEVHEAPEPPDDDHD